jgi:hypothetical protein
MSKNVYGAKSLNLVYPDDCKVSVEPGSITVIGEKSPCATQTAAELPADPALVAAGALATAGAGMGVGVANSGRVMRSAVLFPASGASEPLKNRGGWQVSCRLHPSEGAGQHALLPLCL